MTLNQKLKKLREGNDLTQSDMAEKMHVATNTYARLERGETQINERKLQQIAEIFKIDAGKILSTPEDKIVLLIAESTTVTDNGTNNCINYYGNDKLQMQNETLKLELQHKEKELAEKDKLLETKEQLLTSKDEQIEMLRELLKQVQQK